MSHDLTHTHKREIFLLLYPAEVYIFIYFSYATSNPFWFIKGAIIFYREEAVCLLEDQNFVHAKGVGDQKKLATRDHRQTPPLLVKNDSSLREI